jgi:hypothetical protein
MTVTSVRFNTKEEKLIEMLKKHYNCDTSSLLKKSIFEMYDDLMDNKVINDFEKRESKGKTKFLSFEDIIK